MNLQGGKGYRVWYPNVLRGFCLITCLLWLIGIAIGQEVASDTLEYAEVKVLPGEHCLVSGKPLGPDDICIIVRGRRVPLKKEALGIFLQNPEKYFAGLQPKGALYSEELQPGKTLSLGWFYFGLYVFLGLLFAALTSHTAVAKGLSPIPWFFAGLLVNAFGYLAILTQKSGEVAEVPKGLRKVPLTAPPIICLECGNENHPAAKKCLDCGHPLSPKSESEVDRVGL